MTAAARSRIHSKSRFAAGQVDTCGEISEADEAKLQNRTAVLADIDGVLSQYVLLDYGPTNAAFSTWVSPIRARMPP